MLAPHQVDDFVNLTLKLFKTKKWTDLSLGLQHYASAMMIREKKVMERGGPKINFKIKTKNTGNARNSGLFDQDQTKVEDVTIEAETPWTKQTTNFSYDIDEPLFQSSRETIIEELKIREHDAMSDLAELNEENCWSAPTGPTDNRPMGIPFWLQKDPTTTPDGGFNGGNPAGFSGGAAGVDSALYPRWTNWTGGFTAVSRDDLIRKVKRAITFTYFQPPVPHPELGYGDANFKICTTYRVQEPLERIAETRNDNLGHDVAKYMNEVTIGGVPLRWVPYLEANDTTDPLYGINWQVMRPYVKTGADMRRNPPRQAARQHSVREVHYDTWMNYICYNRRLTWVISLTP